MLCDEDDDEVSSGGGVPTNQAVPVVLRALGSRRRDVVGNGAHCHFFSCPSLLSTLCMDFPIPLSCLSDTHTVIGIHFEYTSAKPEHIVSHKPSAQQFRSDSSILSPAEAPRPGGIWYDTLRDANSTKLV